MMPREMLLRGQRCTTAKQLKAYVHDSVGLHLLGSPGYKSIEELVEKLERIDPNPDSKYAVKQLQVYFHRPPLRQREPSPPHRHYPVR